MDTNTIVCRQIKDTDERFKKVLLSNTNNIWCSYEFSLSKIRIKMSPVKSVENRMSLLHVRLTSSMSLL